MSEDELMLKVVKYFEEQVFYNHIKASLKKHTKLSSYNINPILVQYLSKVLEDEFTPIGVAKALFLPRVLGTSINTSFGTRIQNMFVELEIAEGSLIKGMDIEFIDKVDERKKWCQLKSGPNTINSEDVKPLLKKFSDTIRLAKTNKALKGINNADFIVGVLYGNQEELSQHYKAIDEYHPVFIGVEFWHRVTGYSTFYNNLVSSLKKSIANLETENFVEKGCATLAEEIQKSALFDF